MDKVQSILLDALSDYRENLKPKDKYKKYSLDSFIDYIKGIEFKCVKREALYKLNRNNENALFLRNKLLYTNEIFKYSDKAIAIYVAAELFNGLSLMNTMNRGRKPKVIDDDYLELMRLQQIVFLKHLGLVETNLPYSINYKNMKDYADCKISWLPKLSKRKSGINISYIVEKDKDVRTVIGAEYDGMIEVKFYMSTISRYDNNFSISTNQFAILYDRKSKEIVVKASKEYNKYMRETEIFRELMDCGDFFSLVG